MDSIANMLISLINAQRVGKKRVAVPYSKLTENVLHLLQEKKAISKVRVQDGVKAKLVVTLAYGAEEAPAIQGVRRISKPGWRRYVAVGQLPFPRHGSGFFVISTSQGLMDEHKARRAKVGGELLCEIW